MQSLEEGWATLQPLLVSRAIITMAQLLRKPSVRNIFRKTWILWNFAFYKFSENLGFQRLQKDWATSQQLIIPWHHYHDTAFHKAYSQDSWVSDIFRETCNLRNFVFCIFSEDLGFQPLHKDWTILEQFIIPWYHYHDTASQKTCSQGSWVRDIFRKTCSLRNFAFYKFSENLGFQPLQKHWAILQQFIIPRYHYHGTASQKACSQGSWVRDIFRKTCNLGNFIFCIFSRILVFSPYIRIGRFCNSLSHHGVTTMTQLLRKPAVKATESGIY